MGFQLPLFGAQKRERRMCFFSLHPREKEKKPQAVHRVGQDRTRRLPPHAARTKELVLAGRGRMAPRNACARRGDSETPAARGGARDDRRPRSARSEAPRGLSARDRDAVFPWSNIVTTGDDADKWKRFEGMNRKLASERFARGTALPSAPEIA